MLTESFVSGRVLAGRGCPSGKNRAWLRGRGIAATIPGRDDQIARRRKKPGRPAGFGGQQQERCEGRNVVERHYRMLDEFLEACDKSVAVSRYVTRDEER